MRELQRGRIVLILTLRGFSSTTPLQQSIPFLVIIFFSPMMLIGHCVILSFTPISWRSLSLSPYIWIYTYWRYWIKGYDYFFHFYLKKDASRHYSVTILGLERICSFCWRKYPSVCIIKIQMYVTSRAREGECIILFTEKLRAASIYKVLGTVFLSACSAIFWEFRQGGTTRKLLCVNCIITVIKTSNWNFRVGRASGHGWHRSSGYCALSGREWLWHFPFSGKRSNK